MKPQGPKDKSPTAQPKTALTAAISDLSKSKESDKTMKYQDVRPTIRSGDLVAFSHGSWKSWSDIKVNFVRMFTRSTYSHVAIAWVVGGRVFLLEAVKPKTRIFPLSLEGDFYLLPMNAKWSATTEEFALDHIGVEYSEITAIRAFFNPLEAGNMEQCAAYVREVLLVDGIDLGKRSTPDAVVKAAQDRGCLLWTVSNGGNK
jgi:hypothetical protein